MAEVKIMKFSPYCISIPLVLLGKFHTEIPAGSLSGGGKTRQRWKTSDFLALNVNISKTVEDTSKLLIND